MINVILIALIIIMMLVVAMLLYKSKAERLAHDAAMQKIVSETALSQVKQRTELDQSLTALETRQRQETLDATNPQHLAVRTDLDNDWSADSGLHGNPNAARDDNHSAAAAGSTGTAGD